MRSLGSTPMMSRPPRPLSRGCNTRAGFKLGRPLSTLSTRRSLPNWVDCHTGLSGASGSSLSQSRRPWARRCPGVSQTFSRRAAASSGRQLYIRAHARRHALREGRVLERVARQVVLFELVGCWRRYLGEGERRVRDTQSGERGRLEEVASRRCRLLGGHSGDDAIGTRVDVVVKGLCEPWCKQHQ